ncbi:carbon-nitrogen hydrolase family protein [Streptomyces sp. NPDC057621]|uniref:carbon-nitrogen hydrolase family protein n=1 Tax=Streptomyces sp. NPDC057621 TaxID=3346186 RepID=UPI00369CC59E
MTAPLRVAALQDAARPLDVAGNARRAADSASRAAQDGARLVLLPELHLCAYDLPALSADTATAAVAADRLGRVTDPRLAPLTATAAWHRVTVVVGAAVRRTDGRLTNSLLVAEPGEGITVAYDKRHLWHDEADLFTAGAAPSMLTVAGWRLGLGICYDLSFPEHARAAALAGADVLLYSSAFRTGTEHRAAVYLRARALENTVHTVFANPVGGPADRPCNGTSAVYGPDGGITACTAPGDGRPVLADLDPQAVLSTRAYLRMLAECRDA